MNNTILFVDDEELVLQGIKRVLKSKYNLITFTEATRALEYLKEEKNKPAVIVSDYKMPIMDGAKFLSEAKKISPNSTRMLLTGYADMNATIEVVNNGNIFRFLLKPCPNEVLIKNIDEAIKQYELVIAEKELLAQTLRGTIKLLTDILAALYPKAFTRADSIRYICKKIAQRLNLQNIWEIEITALLSFIGVVTLPQEILDKKFNLQKLSQNEQILFNSHTEIAYSLLNNIPRLNNIAKAILESNNVNSNINDIHFENNVLPPVLIGNLISLANHYYELKQSGFTSLQILEEFSKHKDIYNNLLLSALEAEISGIDEKYIVVNVELKDLPVGYQLADNVTDEDGRILISKGIFITDILKQKLINFASIKSVKEPLKILKKIYQ
jgi:FixJ family two-component response regulator